MIRYHAPIVMLLALLQPGTGDAGQYIEGPVMAEVVRVIDGDTVLVEAMPWPDHRINTYVRLRGIDTPELKSSCPAFREAARKAQDQLKSLMSDQQQVELTEISGDKYFGRVVATLVLADGRRPAELLLEQGLAEPYKGNAKTRHDCPSG
jgi:endonuclease YncB( thermonuclease family)